ncbi:MAG: HEPN domain-containing protein [Nitrospirae bacterium]|nr:HEPN domain-containing protein [Nitrospirota bacterium]
MRGIEEALLTLRMAGKDLRALNVMLAPDSVDDEIFGFHAQQAVEKSLKA